MRKILAIFIYILSLSLSQAHSWYPPECCNGNDCHPVPCDELLEQKDGSVKWDKYSFAKDRIKPSQDSMCHVCVWKYNDQPLCAFTLQSY